MRSFSSRSRSLIKEGDGEGARSIGMPILEVVVVPVDELAALLNGLLR